MMKSLDIQAFLLNISMNKKYWDREDTRTWISTLSLRVEDMNYYKNETRNWCENNNIIDFELVTKCLITTCIWVAHMRQEVISLGEIYDLIHVVDLYDTDQPISDIDVNHVLEFKEGIGDHDLDYILRELIKEESKD